MATIGSLAINVLARTGAFSRGMGRVRGELRGFSKLGRGLNVILGPVGAGLVGVGGAGLAVAKSVGTARSFSQKMANSLAIMGNVSTETQAKMVKAAQQVAFATKFSASDAAEAYFFLASAGLSAEESLAALPKTALFAQAGAFDLATATDLLTDAQSALGLSTGTLEQKMASMVRVSDVLVKANTIANAKVEEFSESLTNKAGGALKFARKEIEEGVAVLAAFADQGVKGAEAGTALNIVLRDLQSKALNNAAAFKAAGIAVFDQGGEMRNMAAIIANLEQKLDGLSTAQKKATLLQLGFTDKSIAFIQTLLGTSEKIAGYEKALRSAGGTTAEVASKQLPPFEKAVNKIKALFESLSINLFAPILDAVGLLFEGLIGKIGGTGDAMLSLGLTAEGVLAGVNAAVGFLADLWDTLRIGFKLGQQGVLKFGETAARVFNFLLDLELKLVEVTFELLKKLKAVAGSGAFRTAADAALGQGGQVLQVAGQALGVRSIEQLDQLREKISTTARDFGAAFADELGKGADKIGDEVNALLVGQSSREKVDQFFKGLKINAQSAGEEFSKGLGVGGEEAAAKLAAMAEKAGAIEEKATLPQAANTLALRGSSEAVSAIQQFRFRGGGKESVDKEQLNVAKKANEILRKVNTGIEGIRDNLTTFSIPAGGGAAA